MWENVQCNVSMKCMHKNEVMQMLNVGTFFTRLLAQTKQYSLSFFLQDPCKTFIPFSK